MFLLSMNIELESELDLAFSCEYWIKMLFMANL